MARASRSRGGDPRQGELFGSALEDRLPAPPSPAAALPEPPETQALFARLARSDFRSRFRLGQEDRDYLAAKGPETVRRHAEAFIGERLAPAHPAKDGRQTPMRGHPVFVAQHATATCCRGCLAKWHGIPKGRPLGGAEQARIVAVLMSWIGRESARQR
ncbi:DUF4186 domain-containing protein [Mangrovicoccus sp. HB161399]|uniref:DUF4186 domain-containing protein n=1 Tax=Mangrovicoccus sp. HB161399 TaxID=2720392 RepID=UPI001553405C|nr:DUF4186 domain-containing protein [Mangrovicoccus sp. HB161399]